MACFWSTVFYFERLKCVALSQNRVSWGYFIFFLSTVVIPFSFSKKKSVFKKNIVFILFSFFLSFFLVEFSI